MSSSTTTTYLLENGEVQVAAEEVISEEVVTDDPVVVLETTGEHAVDLSKRLMENLSSSSNYHMEQVISTSTPMIDLSPPSTKIPALDIPVTTCTCMMSLDSNVSQFTNDNLLTTLANSHFNTETSNSNSACNTGIALSVDQLIENSLTAISSQKCSKGDLATNIIHQMLTPTSDKMVIGQGEGVIIDSVSGPDVTVESEVVISEPMIVSEAGGTSVEEPMVILYNKEEPQNEEVCGVVFEESNNETTH